MKRALFFLFVTIILGSNATAATNTPTRYRLDAGIETMPYYLVLRHCNNAEDTMATLRVVEYTPERVVYRCQGGNR